MGYVGKALTRVIRVSDPTAHLCVIDIRSRNDEIRAVARDQYSEFCCDLRSLEALSEVISVFSPSHVYHLAARHFIPDCLRLPDETMEINVTGTKNVISAVLGLSQKRPPVVIFASSAAVYKNIGHVLHTEGDELDGSDIYGLSKSLAEAAINAKYSGPIRIARLFNIFGENDPWPHLIPNICRQVSEGYLPVQVGNLESVRDYIHIRDVALALYELGARDLPSKAIYNVGSGEGRSGWDVLRAIEAVVGHDIPVVPSNSLLRRADSKFLVANRTKIVREVGWLPTVQFQTGIEEALAASQSLP